MSSEAIPRFSGIIEDPISFVRLSKKDDRVITLDMEPLLQWENRKYGQAHFTKALVDILRNFHYKIYVTTCFPDTYLRLFGDSYSLYMQGVWWDARNAARKTQWWGYCDKCEQWEKFSNVETPRSMRIHLRSKTTPR
jgi:hypothetical protein